MADEKYTLEENPTYKDDDIRKIQTNDDVHADNVVNPLVLRILNNMKAVFKALGGKADKVTGKGLSTNDYTTADKNKLAGVANNANNYVHPSTHPYSMITGAPTSLPANGGTAESAKSVPWTGVTGKPTTFPATTHKHDDRYYTEAEINAQMAGKASTNGIIVTNNRTALGNYALVNAGVVNCTAVGYYALKSNTTGDLNVALGTNALKDNTTGDHNTAIGNSSQELTTTGSYNTSVGSMTLQDVDGISNVTAIGYAAQVTGSNQAQIGNSGVTTYTYGAVQNRSDARDKSDIRDTALGLDFIKALRPVDFKWNYREDYHEDVQVIETVLDEDGYPEQTLVTRILEHDSDGTKTRKRYHHGLIAQEVKGVIDELGIDFGGYQDHSINGGKDVLSIGYSELIAPLIKSVQELSNTVEVMQKRIDTLEEINIIKSEVENNG